MNALVTGANRGIGLELCKRLIRQGRAVIAVCRTSSSELAALGCHVEAGIDVADAAAPALLAQRLSGVPLSLVIHNAGILTRESLDAFNVEQIEKQWQVNALGPLRLTHALLPNLGTGSKVAFITSRMGSIGDNTSGGMYGYRMSKAALNMAAVSLSKDLKPKGIAVAVLHPGYVQTGMTRGNGDVTPDVAAERLLSRIDELTLETSGTFWHAEGQVLPW